MGLSRIFACAVLGTLFPTVILAYLLVGRSSEASAEIKACEAAQGFVRDQLGTRQAMSFLPCDESKEMKLPGGAWQVLGDVELGQGAVGATKEAYVVRLKLGADGADLESLSLR
jgi:hypothetical protein